MLFLTLFFSSLDLLSLSVHFITLQFQPVFSSLLPVGLFFSALFLASDIIPYHLHLHSLDTRSCTYSYRALTISFTFPEGSETISLDLLRRWESARVVSYESGLCVS